MTPGTFNGESGVWRVLLAIMRPGQLVTVWSNCLAGWWLGGGGNHNQWPYLFGGATLLFLGGACLNDAFDIGFDRQHRRNRPVPARRVGLKTVWRSGLVLLIAGALVLYWPGRVTGGLGLGLVWFIVIQNALHRVVSFSPVLMGICRFFLYVLGASTGEWGVTGWAIWAGLALAAYVTGARYLEDLLEQRARPPRWPVLLLGTPLALGIVMNSGDYRKPALLLLVIAYLWVARCIRRVWWAPESDRARAVSGLIAGIVFMDWLAACPVLVNSGQFILYPRELNLAFPALFLLTLLLQWLASGQEHREHSGTPNARG